MSRISTGTGDRGTTGLADGSRVPKTSLRIAAVGAVDEANDVVGLAATYADAELRQTLEDLQRDLFTVGADLAAPQGAPKALRLAPERIRAVESLTDRLEAELPPLARFILPGGAPVAAHLQLARSVVRRAERSAWALREVEPVSDEVLVYLNRLADCLFLLAREANRRAGASEPEWAGRRA